MSDDSESSQVKKEHDRALGMGAKITRRDFLNGVALTAGAAIVPSFFLPEMWSVAAADLPSEDQDLSLIHISQGHRASIFC